VIRIVGASVRIVTILTGIVGAALIGALLWFPAHAQRALGSCLAAWIMCLDISLGSLGMLMMHRLTGGGWIAPIRAYLRAALVPLPLLLILFIPVLIAAFHLFPWSRGMPADGPMAFKADYLAGWPFIVRSLIALGAWCVLAQLQRHRIGSSAGFSAVGLIVYAVTLSWSTVDWIGSLEPHWSSSILGLVVLTEQGLAAFAFVTLCATRLPSPARRPGAHECGDLAGLLLTFVMSWAYLAFMQFLIVWAEDLPRETNWYVPRMLRSWRYLSLIVVLAQFAVPFTLLLFRRIKRHPAGLGATALLLVVAHGLYVFWLIVPSLNPDGWNVAWSDPIALICVGVPWLWVFVRALAGSAQRPDADAITDATDPKEALHVR
jgi:hypothetical protein